MSDTVVFVPAWNEEQNLPAVLEDLRGELPDVDVLVVDDGSTDRTAEVPWARIVGFRSASRPDTAGPSSTDMPSAAAWTPTVSTQRRSWPASSRS